jgi:prickle
MKFILFSNQFFCFYFQKKMLEKQLPPHDSDPKYCRSLSEEEKNELRIFNEQQRHNAFGRGVAKQLPLTQSPVPCRGVS